MGSHHNTATIRVPVVFIVLGYTVVHEKGFVF